MATFLVVILVVLLSRGFWISEIGRSLVCVAESATSDIILVENFDPNYLLFERAAALERAGVAPKTVVPVHASRDSDGVNPISKGIAEVMARQARLRNWGIIPVEDSEPISLNAAAQIRRHLRGNHINSVLVVTPGFRSRRSSLVYRAVLANDGTQVHCVPVFGARTPERWAETWHGIQEVAEEFLKLQYYRFYVIPFVARGHDGPLG